MQKFPLLSFCLAAPPKRWSRYSHLSLDTPNMRLSVEHTAHTWHIDRPKHRNTIKKTRLQTVIALNPFISLFCWTRKRTVFGFKKLMSTWNISCRSSSVHRKCCRVDRAKRAKQTFARHAIDAGSHASGNSQTCARNLSGTWNCGICSLDRWNCGLRHFVRDEKADFDLLLCTHEVDACFSSK